MAVHQVKLYVLVGLTGMLFGGELVASQVSKSFILLADAYHTLYNFLSVLLMIIAYRTSKVRTLMNTFGWARLEVLGVFFNALVLCSLCFAMCLGAFLHILHASHDPIRPHYPLLVLTFGLLGLLYNAVCVLLIGGFTRYQECYLTKEGGEDRLRSVAGEQPRRQSCDVSLTTTIKTNVAHGNKNDQDCQKSVRTVSNGELTRDSPRSGCSLFIGVVRDASTCILVVLSACTVYFAEEPLGGALADYADPVACVLGVILQILTTYPFLKETGLILLQSIPNNMDVEQLKEHIMKEFPEIKNVHDLHVWKQSKSQVIATLHVVVPTHEVYAALSSKLQIFFQERGIASATVQPEFHNDSFGNMVDCILPCTADCLEPNCCRPKQEHDALRQRHKHHHHHSHNHHDHVNVKELQQVAKATPEQELLRSYDYSNIKHSVETTL